MAAKLNNLCEFMFHMSYGPTFKIADNIWHQTTEVVKLSHVFIFDFEEACIIVLLRVRNNELSSVIKKIYT